MSLADWYETTRSFDVSKIQDLRKQAIDNLIAQQSNPEDNRKIISSDGVSTGQYRIVRAELEKKQEALERLNRVLLEKRPELASQIETEMQQTGVLNPPKQFFTQEGLNKLTSGRTDALSTWFDGFTPFNPQQARPAQQPTQQLFQQPAQQPTQQPAQPAQFPQQLLQRVLQQQAPFTQQVASQFNVTPLKNNISNFQQTLQQQPFAFNFLQSAESFPQSANQLFPRLFLQPNFAQQQKGLLNVLQPSYSNNFMNMRGLLGTYF